MICHYVDVIMTTMASQITSLTVVYSAVYSDADQRKHQSSASLAFVWGIHRDRWIPRTKGQLRGKCFHLMTSSCHKPLPVTHGLYETIGLLCITKHHPAPPRGIPGSNCSFRIVLLGSEVCIRYLNKGITATDVFHHVSSAISGLNWYCL